MRGVKCAGSAALIGVLAFGALALSAVPCRAQLGSARIIRPRQQEAAGPVRPWHLTVGPALILGIDNDAGQTRSIGAAVIAVERGLSAGTGEAAAQIGGFFYFKGNDYLYQLHGKYYFNRNAGVQLSYLNGSADSDDFAAYGLYNISSRTRDPNARVPWDVQFGLGGYFPGDSGSDDAVTGYVQLSVGLSERLTLDTSYWGIFPGNESSINRFLVGLGFNF